MGGSLDERNEDGIWNTYSARTKRRLVDITARSIGTQKECNCFFFIEKYVKNKNEAYSYVSWIYEKANLFTLSPCNNCFIMRYEIVICLWKWMRPEKTAVSWKWGWMRTRDNIMPFFVYHVFFRDGIISPQNKNDMLSSFWRCLYHLIRERFPSFSFVRSRLSGSNRQNRIQKKHSLFCPIREICLCPFDTNISFELLEYIFETWLRFWTIWHRKRKSHRSTRSMVGILSKYDDFYIFKWSRIKGTKNIFLFWKTCFYNVFFFYKVYQLMPVWFFKFVMKNMFPWWMDTNNHRNNYIENARRRKWKILT